MKADRADKRCIAARVAPKRRGADRRLGRERGQALVEFALIAPLFVALVAGVIQFGVALNYWLDLQRLANQGARWAVVNCAPTGVCGTDLRTKLQQEVVSKGNAPVVDLCYPSTTGAPAGTPTVGDPVRVRLKVDYRFVPIIRVAKITLTAAATMRLEQKPTNAALASAVTPCPP